MRVIIRSVRSDTEGVASTVGTIMALLVFLTFLSLIVNQYVPAWMKDSESSHMNAVIGQFGSLKGNIDLQILAAGTAQIYNVHYIPYTSANPVVLGVDGVPIFAAATRGRISASPDPGLFTVTFDYLIQGVRTRVTDSSSGSIELEVGNRYYVPQRVAYENGAVIRYQTDGQVVRALPTFAVGSLNNSLDVSFGLVSLYGTGGVTATTTEVVNTQVFAYDRQDYVNFPSNAVVWINHTSRYGLAWYRFMNETLSDALHLGGTYTWTSLDQTFVAKIGATTAYIISASYNPSTQLYNLRFELRNNPGVLVLAAFRLAHTQVQVKIGEATQNAQL